jgi:hypothetical protein
MSTQELTKQFFEAYLAAFPNRTVFTNDTPEEMMGGSVDEEGWFDWKILKGTLQETDYRKLELKYKIELPKSFIAWHKEYFFLNGDTSILRLPASNPKLPLKDVESNLNWFIPEQLISKKLYPFADEGNDAGQLVFDGRNAVPDNEFPIRVYFQEFGGDMEGLSEIIFSSFRKLLECLTHYLTERKTRKDFEIIPDFFKIDPTGAGSSSIGYWQTWVELQKSTFED